MHLSFYSKGDVSIKSQKNETATSKKNIKNLRKTR